MQITATVRKGTHVDRLWRDRRQITGLLCGAKFKLTHSGFVADNLSADSAEQLRHSPYVQLSFTSVKTISISDVEAMLGDLLGDLETPSVAVVTDAESLLPVRTKRAYNRHGGANY
jgi:hypothetical protein